MKGDEINAWRNAMEAANYTFEHNGVNGTTGSQRRRVLSHRWRQRKRGNCRRRFSGRMRKTMMWMTAEELIALSEAAEQAMFTKGMEIHVRQRTMKKELEKLTSADEILAYRVGWAQEYRQKDGGPSPPP
ncbi:DUF4376 domain-containing protein [Escherichia coli]|nr:DUF4376 domain-containing protein [Escherichia coli]